MLRAITQEEVMAAAGYDPEADLENPPSSVFCAHGAGFVVPWDQVEEYMHLEAVALPSEKGSADEKEASGIAQSSRAEYFVRERKETRKPLSAKKSWKKFSSAPIIRTASRRAKRAIRSATGKKRPHGA